MPTREADALGNDGVGGNPVEKQNLVSAGPEEVPHRSFLPIDRSLEVGIQVMVQPSPPGQSAEYDLAQQTGIRILGCVTRQEGIGVGALVYEAEDTDRFFTRSQFGCMTSHRVESYLFRSTTVKVCKSP